MATYLLFKSIHILAVVIFLGNIITGLFWMLFAHRTRNILIINHAMRGIILADRYFTIPGVIVILVGGIVSAMQGGFPILRTGWIFWSIVMFSISGIAFAWKVAPLQKKIFKMSSDSSRRDFDMDWKEYERLFTSWELWGLIAMITPLMAMVFMVMKWPTGSIF